MDKKQLKKYEEKFVSLGLKENLIYVLFLENKALNIEEISKKSKIPVSQETVRTILHRNIDEFFSFDHKEGKINFFSLSERGKTFVENYVKEQEEKKNQVKEEKNVIESWKELLDDSKISDDNVLLIDFKELIKFDYELGEEILERPEESIKILKTLIREDKELSDDKKVDVLIKNLPKDCDVRIRDFRAKHIDKLFFTEGIIKRKSTVMPMITGSKFECPSCGTIINVRQDGEFYAEPTRCSCGRKGYFKLLDEEYSNVCYIILEEHLWNEQPQILKLVLTGYFTHSDIIEKIKIGRGIKVTGVIKKTFKYSHKGKKKLVVDSFFLVNNLEFLEDQDFNMALSESDKKKCLEIGKDIDEKGLTKSLFLKSFAPYSIGNEEIKECLTLQLVCPKNDVNPDGTVKRRKFHMLLFGDTGSNKTKNVQYAKKLMPKAQYCTGSTSSGVGLLASVIKDDMLGWVAEAGVIVLANNSICYIDEIDKLSPEDMGKLHEVMSEQQITLNKANIHTTIPVQTGITIVGNPSKGKFDVYSDLSSQVLTKHENNLSFLNRFDLVIFIRDNADEEKDKLISDSMFMREKGVLKGDLLKFHDLKNFIIFVNQHENPEWEEDAEDYAKKFYKEFRQLAMKNNCPVPVTARLIESIQRFSCCYARLRLSKIIEIKDVISSILLIKKGYQSMGLEFVKLNEEEKV